MAALDRMALSIGTRLGPYQILASIGAGGMGAVYLAHDPRTGRDVAIKVTSERFSDRFSREVHAVAALNHPHICQLYDVGPDYLVMELCDGETLADRLERGALPVKEAVLIASQIAGALCDAHGHGVVHRDLKPGNVMLTKAGAKVLDFGLAKIAHSGRGTVETETLTAERTVLGTVPYMSPEQVQGKEVDARSDIFSFGLVFYEMLTGKRAFNGSSPVSIMAAILERDAPSLEPEGLNRVVQACLAKDPADRFQSARDLQRAMEWEQSGEGKTAVPKGTARAWLPWGVAAAAVVALGVSSWTRLVEKPAAVAPLRFQLTASKFSTNVSPDGRKLVFFSEGRLGVHSLETGESRELTVSEGGAAFWSPDSRSIAYPTDGKLKRIDAAGGSPQTIVELPVGSLWTGGSWSKDDVILYGDRRVGLYRIPAVGGASIPVTVLDSTRHETSQYRPTFLPDGRHFLYARTSTDAGKTAIYLGSLDARPNEQNLTPLVTAQSGAAYAASTDPNMGYLLFVRDRVLMAQLFDLRRLEVQGQPIAVAGQMGGGYGAFSAASNNVLVYRPIIAPQLTWFDRQGRIAGVVAEPGIIGNLSVSTDGTRLAGTRGGTTDAANIWLMDLSREGAWVRFTFDRASAASPVWAPDGSQIVFSSNRDGPFNLYQKPADGSKDEKVMLKSGEDKLATSWSGDGRLLLYESFGPQMKNDLWVLPLMGGGKPVAFMSTPFNDRQGRFSPDGKWVAYTSDESGQDEIYVRSFAMNAAGTAVEAGARWPVSKGYGVDPRWRKDGREIYYRSRSGVIVAVGIEAKPGFRAGQPESLKVSTSPFVNSVGGPSWEAAPDGSRFLLLVPPSETPPYTVVVNWQSGLNK